MPIAHYRVIAATSIRARAREQPVPDTPRSGSLLLARLAESARKSAQRTHRYLPSGGARLSRKAHTLRARATVYTPRDGSRARNRPLLRFRFPVSGFRFPILGSRFLAEERGGLTRLGAQDMEDAHDRSTESTESTRSTRLRDAYSYAREATTEAPFAASTCGIELLARGGCRRRPVGLGRARKRPNAHEVARSWLDDAT